MRISTFDCLALGAAVLAVTGAAAGPAAAQEATTAPTGVHLGAFQLYPAVSVALLQDDNVYATDTNTEDSTITSISPSLVLRSGWSRHELTLAASAEHRAYSDLSDEDRTTWRAGASGRVDIRRDARLRGTFDVADDREMRGQFDPLGLAEPIEYHSTDGSVAFEKDFNRVRIGVGAAASRLDYEDGRLFGGGVVDQDFRDRDEREWNGRVDYGLSPDTSLFISFADRSYDYDSTIFGDRDFEARQALAGAHFDITRLVQGEIGIGYVWSDYDNPAQPDLDGFSANGSVTWFPSRLTTVTFSAARNVQESGIVTSSSVLRESYGVRVDHELLRSVGLWAAADRADDDFNAIDRDDRHTHFGLGADWTVNRLAKLGLGYNAERHTSDGAQRYRDYDRDVFGVTLTLSR